MPDSRGEQYNSINIQELLESNVGTAYEEFQYYDSAGSYAESSNNWENSSTIFDIASITKLFTAAILLKTIENREIGFDRKISTFFSWSWNSNLRIIDLLTHQVKFDFWLAEIRKQYPNLEAFKNYLFSIRLPNSSNWEIYYHNLGYIYLGFVLEKIYSLPLGEIFRRFFTYLKLDNTFCGDELPPFWFNIPITEIIEWQIIKWVTHDESARILGGISWNAWIFSTAKDLVQFWKKWQDWTIVSEAFFYEHVLRDYDLTGNTSQALSWWMRIPWFDRQLWKTLLSHPGYTGGLLSIKPRGGDCMAFLSNRTIYWRDNEKHRGIIGSLVEKHFFAK